MNILIVDDLATNRKLLRAQLEAEGFAVVEAADGVEALQVLARQPLDAVISDILMPRMDGYRLCHEVRKNPTLLHLRFVLYSSTYTSPADVRLSGTVGADQFIAKPAPIATIMEALQIRADGLGSHPLDRPDETIIFEQYSSVLVAKLEEKNTELKQALEMSRRAHHRIEEMNADLERRVQERTAELATANGELTTALADVKQLTELLPVCSYCKSIRDGKDYWDSLENYITRHTNSNFSHGVCPTCHEKHVAPQLKKLGLDPLAQPTVNRSTEPELVGALAVDADQNRALARVDSRAVTPGGPVPMNILIVDDHPSNLKLLRAVLEGEGMTTCEAVDGVEALAALNQVHVDAIVSDVFMPRMDGYHLCKEVRASLAHFDVPFIAYTANYVSTGDEKLMFELGADRFLRKPAPSVVLATAVVDVIRSKPRRSPPLVPSNPDSPRSKNYNVRRVAKLEEKNVELEAHVALLSRAEEARTRAELRLHLQHAITAVFAEAASVSAINQKFLATLGNGLQWEFGELWTIEPGAHVLRRTEVWHLLSDKFLEFASNRHITLASGEGLPGRVWASGQAEWLTKSPSETTDVHLDQASRIGLRGWIGFPIKLRQHVVGVVVFFSHEMKKPDAGLLAFLDAIGLQIGQFIERQQLANQFRQAQKMEAIGTLAGGIAHDFNNILGAIYGYCELAGVQATGNATLTGHLDAVMAGARRATDLVRQILAFSRDREQERRPIQLRHIVAEAMRLLRAAVPSTIEFHTLLKNDAPVVLADETQVHQILMNLCTNAAHAMRKRGGRLTVKLEDCHVGPELVATCPELHVGRYARLTVGDTGHGMNAETLRQIYEPFFTTKPLGEGTGLGLAVVQGIVKSHEGAITVSSRCGEGTTFLVYFPAQLVDAEKVVKEDSALPHGTGERILFVDDEVALADVGKQVLDYLGYVTDTCSNARQAIDLVAADPAAYTLVITDQMMPGMTGTDLAQRLHAIRPDLPVILATGCTDTWVPDRLRAMGIQQLLVKPLSVQALAVAVHQVFSCAIDARL